MTAEPAEIQYFQIAGFAKDMFRCDAWRANLSVPACSGRWTEAQTAKGIRAEELERCRNCRIGARHAGSDQAERSTFYGSNVCPRCRRGTFRRLVRSVLCISCANRQYERRRGRNARGNVPIELKPVYQLPVRYAIEGPSPAGRVLVGVSPPVIDRAEAILGVLRNAEGGVRFGFAAPSPRSVQ